MPQAADSSEECDPIVHLCDAPIDDEPMTAEDETRMRETHEHIRNGTTITTEELLRRLRL